MRRLLFDKALQMASILIVFVAGFYILEYIALGYRYDFNWCNYLGATGRSVPLPAEVICELWWWEQMPFNWNSLYLSLIMLAILHAGREMLAPAKPQYERFKIQLWYNKLY